MVNLEKAIDVATLTTILSGYLGLRPGPAIVVDNIAVRPSAAIRYPLLRIHTLVATPTFSSFDETILAHHSID